MCAGGVASMKWREEVDRHLLVATYERGSAPEVCILPYLLPPTALLPSSPQGQRRSESLSYLLKITQPISTMILRGQTD